MVTRTATEVSTPQANLEDEKMPKGRGLDRADKKISAGRRGCTLRLRHTMPGRLPTRACQHNGGRLCPPSLRKGDASRSPWTSGIRNGLSVSPPPSWEANPSASGITGLALVGSGSLDRAPRG